MNKFISAAHGILFIFIIFTIPNLSLARTYYEDFDAGDLAKSELDRHGGCYEHSFKVVDAPAGRAGKNDDGKALQVHLKGWEKNEPCQNWSVGKSRAEIRYGKNTEVHGFPEGEPVLISWHMFFPASFPNDAGYIIVAQVIGKGPGPELHFMAGKGGLHVERAWLIEAGGSKQKEKIHKQKLPLDTWIHATVYLKRSSSADGQIKIWIDGEEVADVQGPNVLIHPEDIKGPYFKAGAYFGPKHRDSEYTVLFDDVLIVNP